MSRKQQVQAVRTCRLCGAPSDKRAVCSRCSPNRHTREHVDKYDERTS